MADTFFENIHTLTDFEDRAFGCVIGAFIGDSIGSYTEFRSIVDEDTAEKALTMPGGGPFNLSPGQVTDDSELALSLARGIVDSLDWNCPDSIHEMIAKQYGAWLASHPFDKGRTTYMALCTLLDKKPTDEGWAAECIRNSQKYNAPSESNGGLMRATPLAVYCATINDVNEVIKLARVEQSLTHSNKTAQDAGISYVLAIRHLIRERGDVRGAIDIVKKFVQDQEGDIHTYLDQLYRPLLPGNERIGWAKIAWTYAFRCLTRDLSYLESMRMVLRQAGDTDTNCAIVGGMIGASLGIKKLCEEIPSQITVFQHCKVDDVSCTNRRPHVFSPFKIVDLITRILRHQKSPSSANTLSSGFTTPIL